MKRVAIVSAMRFNTNSAGSKRVGSYCRSLSSKVDSIYLISLYSKNVDDRFEFERFKDNIYSGIESKNSQSIKSTFRFLSPFKKFISENPKSKIILYPSSFFVFDLAIVLYMLFKRIPFNVELNEVRKYNLYLLKRNLLKKENLYHNIKAFSTYPFHLIMDFLYKKSAGHIYISSTIAGYYKKKNSIIIPILCNSKNLSVKNVKTYSSSDIFNIGFAGTIDPYKEKMTTFFNAIRILSKTNKNIRVNLYGYIPNKNEFFTLLDQYDVRDYFIYNGMIDKDMLLKKLKEDNHLLILPRGFTKQNYYGFSTKLSEYLETQLPVLTSTIGDISNYFIDMKNSFTYEPDNVESLTKKLEFIIKNYNSVSLEIIYGGDKLVNEIFHYSSYSEKLHSFLFDRNEYT